jgi:hypothetical protein
MGNFLTSPFFQEDIEEFNKYELFLQTNLYFIIDTKTYYIPIQFYDATLYFVGELLNLENLENLENNTIQISPSRFNDQVTIHGILWHFNNLLIV